MESLKNKVIVVTGGSGLIGSAMMRYLLKIGARAINLEISVENNPDRGEFHCDITSQDSVKAAIDQVLKHYGRIDGWVNNAYPRTPDWGNKFEDINPESWAKNVDFQMNSVFIACQAVLRVMKEQKAGAIVNISSIYGVVGPDFTVYDNTEMTMPAAYSAIKGGVVNLTRYLASYYGPSGLRVNCVSPGGIFDHQNEQFVAQYEGKVPMRRMGLPDDIAAPVAFLLSDEAAYITGHNLMVDGGWTAI